MNIMRQFVGVWAVFRDYPERRRKCSIPADNLNEPRLGIPTLALALIAANLNDSEPVVARITIGKFEPADLWVINHPIMLKI